MVEEIIIKQWKAADGKLYDSLGEAERADRYWRAENIYDVDKIIQDLEQDVDRDIRREAIQTEKGNLKSYPILVISKTKYGDVYMLAYNQDAFTEACWGIFVAHLNQEYYFWNKKDSAVSEVIFRTENKKAARSFVMLRTEHEYEGIEIEYPTVYK